MTASLDPRTDLLGRGVIIRPGQPVPEPWDALIALDAFAGTTTVHVVDVSAAAIRDGSTLQVTVDQLHAAWVNRRPFVIRLHIDPSELHEPSSFNGSPLDATDSHDFLRERLRHLIRANNYDARDGELIWWPARTAAKLGGSVHDGPDGDLVLPDGTVVWIDGGPRGIHEAGGLPVIHREAVHAGRLTIERDAAPTFPLAPDQHAAVTHKGGAARIIAPAGSGKTRVLTQRIEVLVNRGWEPSSILALAYNTRAAEEMRQRLPDAPVEIRTVHSFARELLMRHARFRGLRQPRVINEMQVRKILGELVTEPDFTANNDPWAAWIDALATCRLALVPPRVLAESSDALEEFDRVFPAYQQVLRDQNLIDFDEMVYRAADVLLRDGEFRSQVQDQYKHVLWDEIQDATPVFLLLVRLVAAPELDVFGVGDPQQTIYGWAGANPAYIVNFDRWFPGAADHPLGVNYRCPPQVVEAANRLLLPTPVSLPAPIQAAPGRAAQPDAIEVVLTGRADIPVTAAARVRSWLAEGVPGTEIAVLGRVNSGLLPVQALLSDADVTFAQALDESILERTGMRAALAYLALAEGGRNGPLPGPAMFEVANRPMRRMTRKTRNLIRSQAYWERKELVEAVAAGGRSSDVDALTNLLADVDGLRRKRALSRTTTKDLLVHVSDKIGLVEAVASLDEGKPVSDKSSHSDDLDALAAVAELHPKPAGFETWLRGLLRKPVDPSGVRLSTVHRTKGLEWNRVVVVDVTLGKFPHDGSSDEQEERRIFHVAITRAKERLCLLGSDVNPSPYLADAHLKPAASGQVTQMLTIVPTNGSGSVPPIPVAIA